MIKFLLKKEKTQGEKEFIVILAALILWCIALSGLLDSLNI